MMSLLEQQVGSRLPMSLLFENPTILRLSAAIMAGATPLERPLQLVQEGSRDVRPFFFLHGDYLGGGYYCVSWRDDSGRRCRSTPWCHAQ
jgi:hypothetical protein